MESPLANKVTSQPRATRPSAILPATVSHAPYCRGGVRQATGDRTATLFPVRIRRPAARISVHAEEALAGFVLSGNSHLGRTENWPKTARPLGSWWECQPKYIRSEFPVALKYHGRT